MELDSGPRTAFGVDAFRRVLRAGGHYAAHAFGGLSHEGLVEGATTDVVLHQVSQDEQREEEPLQAGAGLLAAAQLRQILPPWHDGDLADLQTLMVKGHCKAAELTGKALFSQFAFEDVVLCGAHRTASGGGPPGKFGRIEKEEAVATAGPSSTAVLCESIKYGSGIERIGRSAALARLLLQRSVCWREAAFKYGHGLRRTKLGLMGADGLLNCLGKSASNS